MCCRHKRNKVTILNITRKINKHLLNPLLSPKDIPYPAEQVYNAGVTKFQGKYVMVFRNDYERTQEDFAYYSLNNLGFPPVQINIGIAFSDDGIHWEVAPKPCFELKDDDVLRAYDPRLTVLEGKCYMCDNQ